MPDEFVERVVPPDVLAEGDQLATRGEERRRVEPTGRLEHALRAAERLRQRGDDRARDDGPVGDGLTVLFHLVERRLAAEATTGVRHELARRHVELDRPAESHGHDVELLLARAGQAVRDGVELARIREHSLRAAEADRELEVVAGSAHGDREGRGSWPGPCTRISMGSSVTSVSGCSLTVSPSTARTRTRDVARRTAPSFTASR